MPDRENSWPEQPPQDYRPLPSQVPPFVTSDDELRRWNWCWACTVAYLGFPSPTWTRELYDSDIPVDPGEAQAEENAGPA
jgi:hypothetical protein